MFTRERERERERERGSCQIDPQNRTQPRKPDPPTVSVSDHPTGQGRYRSKYLEPLVIFPSSFPSEKQPKSHRSKPLRTAESPPLFATIWLVSGHANGWFLLLTSPPFISDYPHSPAATDLLPANC